jgi:hypothetical protein
MISLLSGSHCRREHLPGKLRLRRINADRVNAPIGFQILNNRLLTLIRESSRAADAQQEEHSQNKR